MKVSCPLLYIFILCLFQFTGCGNKELDQQTSRVSIKLPISSRQFRSSHQSENDDLDSAAGVWGGTNPSTGSDYNCFVVAYDTSGGTGGTTCYDDNNTQLFRANGGEGWAVSGGTLTLDLPKQNGIRLYLVGTVATSSANCGSLTSTDANSANLANPRLLSTTTVNVVADDESFTLAGNHGSSILVDRCVGDFDWTTTSTYTNSCTGHTTDLYYNDNGAGTSTNPYMICNIDQFNDIGTSACSASTSVGCDKYYRLGSNISFSGATFVPIGGVGATFGDFSGNFDGQNYALANISLSSISGGSAGIFRSLTNTASVSDLEITNPYINLPATNYVGILSGQVTSSSSVSISNVKIIGGTVAGLSNVGGLIGNGTTVSIQGVELNSTAVIAAYNAGGIVSGLSGANSISMSKFSGQVVTSSPSIGSSIGGIVGINTASSLTLNKVKAEITNLSCNGSSTAFCRMGGLVGYSSLSTGNSLDIRNSFSTITNAEIGHAGSTPPSFVGGIIGYPEVAGSGTNIVTTSYSIMTVASAIPATVYVGGAFGNCNTNVVVTHSFAKISNSAGTANTKPFCGNFVGLGGSASLNRWSSNSTCNSGACTDGSAVTSTPDGNLQPSTSSAAEPFGDGANSHWSSSIWTFASNSFPTLTGL